MARDCVDYFVLLHIKRIFTKSVLLCHERRDNGINKKKKKSCFWLLSRPLIVFLIFRPFSLSLARSLALFLPPRHRVPKAGRHIVLFALVPLRNFILLYPLKKSETLYIYIYKDLVEPKKKILTMSFLIL